MALEAGYTVACYTAVEIDDLSRAIAWRVIGKFQEEFPRQLPDNEIRGCFKRLPHDICFVGEEHIRDLLRTNGAIHFIGAGWQCQSMSLAGHHQGANDDRFLPLYDLIKIINYLQANQFPKPLYLIENTWPGRLGEYLLVDQAA